MKLLLLLSILHTADVKEQISSLKKENTYASKAELASLYYKDQQQEEAFQTFLEALKIPPVSCAMSGEEKAVYDEALKTYLDPALSPNDIATALLEKYETHVQEHPDWYHMSYFMAVSHANKNRFDLFFTDFWRAYSHVTNHFLAFKAAAVLHIKLAERARTQEARDAHRAQVVQFVQKAIELEMRDASLYRYLLSFAAKAEKERLLVQCLNKIITNNIIMPRTDIAFYVQEAVECKQFALAKRFLEQARGWYSYSRVIESAEKHLDQEMKKT